MSEKLEEFPKGKLLILYDGMCVLCNHSIRFVIKHDKLDRFLFSSLQSELGLEISKKFKVNRDKIDTVLLYENETILKKSSAIIAIISELGSLFCTINILKLVPTKLLDTLYDFIAVNRYKWFGKLKSCEIPDSRMRGKIIG